MKEKKIKILEIEKTISEYEDYKNPSKSCDSEQLSRKEENVKNRIYAFCRATDFTPAPKGSTRFHKAKKNNQQTDIKVPLELYLIVLILKVVVHCSAETKGDLEQILERLVEPVDVSNNKVNLISDQTEGLNSNDDFAPKDAEMADSDSENLHNELSLHQKILSYIFSELKLYLYQFNPYKYWIFKNGIFALLCSIFSSLPLPILRFALHSFITYYLFHLLIIVTKIYLGIISAYLCKSSTS